MDVPMLLAVPNLSEGRNQKTIAALAQAFGAAGEPSSPANGAPDSPPAGVRVLDIHSDGDHHRSVFTIAGRQGSLVGALLAGAREAVLRIDVMSRGGRGAKAAGQHPHVGALDVAPVVYLDGSSRGAACAEALALADRIGAELEVPVFLYGELTRDDGVLERTRAELRRGGVAGLTARVAAGELAADFGPQRMHPSAGATLVAAREPLVAFNLQLAPPSSIEDARRIATLVRDGGGEGLPGVRAMAVALAGDVAQVSMNVERPLEVSLAMVAEAVGRHAEIATAELVGLAPRAALEGFPPQIAMPGFDPARHVIENALGC